MPAERIGERVSLTETLIHLDGRATSLDPAGVEGGTAYAWDHADSTTTTWWPQGLTTSAESTHAGQGLSGRTVVLAAWYAKGRFRRADSASRVSILDLTDPTDPRYTHVLLVEPQRSWRIGRWRPAPVRVHAGGLVWLEHVLLVTDTWRGFRVFHLQDLVRVDPTPHTYGCRYLLPQQARWSAGVTGGQRPLRWSFASLDRGDASQPWLVAGEYTRGGTGARLARLPLAPLLRGDTAETVEIVTTNVPSMQGAVRVGGRYWVSASHGPRRRGHLWVGSGDAPFRKYAEALPVGPEDLSYDAGTGRLWTQTEHPGKRRVLSFPLPAGV